MREFVFDLIYEDCPAPIRQGVPDYSVASRAVGGSLGTDEFWRIERLTGTPDAIATIDEERIQTVLAAERLTETACRGEYSIELLSRSGDSCEVYYHVSNLADCETVETLTTEYLGTDVLFELTRENQTESWTVMMEDEEHIGLFYDALQMSRRPEIRFVFDHVGEASDRRFELFAEENLPPEQRQALVRAVRHGYYETPRQTTIEALADELNCAESTLSYRLRRAESTLAKSFATDTTPELAGLPKTDGAGELS